MSSDNYQVFKNQTLERVSNALRQGNIDRLNKDSLIDIGTGNTTLENPSVSR